MVNCRFQCRIGISAALLAFALGPALLVIGAAERPSPSTQSVDQAHQKDPTWSSKATSRIELQRLLESELDKLNGEFSQGTVQRVRADVDRYCRLGGDNTRLVSLICALRYLRDKRLFDTQQFNPTVQKQLNALSEHVFDSFAHGMFGAVPLGEPELRELCKRYQYAPAFSAIDPHFRVLLTKPTEDEIRTKLRARMQEMARQRQATWMNAAGVSDEDRRILWRAFVRDTIDRLIVIPTFTNVNGLVAEYEDERLTSLAKDIPARPVEKPFVPPEAERSPFDQLRTSNERVYSVPLLLLPILADLTTSNVMEWRSYLITLHLRSAFPPYTEVSTSMSVGLCQRWWIIVFETIESNDDRLLAERKLLGRCFVYDTATSRLYEHLPNEPQLSVLMEGVGQRFDGSAYFLADYRCGDVLNAFNCANSLARAWTLRNVAHSTNAQSLSVMAELATVFGRPSSPCSLRKADEQSVELALSDDQILLQGRTEDRGVVLTNAALPAARCSFHLAPNQELAGKGAHVPVSHSIFPQGVIITRIAKSSPETTVILRAPGRLEGTATVRERSNPLPRHHKEPSEEEATQFSAHLLRSSALLNLRHALGRILADSFESKQATNLAADLYLLNYLESSTAEIPKELRFLLNDVKIGLLLATGRKGDALTVLAIQERLLQSNTDKDYVQAYLEFYTGQFHSEPGKVASARTPLPSFVSYAAWEKEHSQGAVEQEYSRPPYFTIALKQPNAPRANESAPRENIASQLNTLLGEQYSQRETATYVKGQLDLLWNTFPEYRFVSKESSTRILSLWKAASQSIPPPTNDYLWASKIVLLTWQTYHCLVADHHALAPEESSRKSSQLRRLKKVLEQLDSEIARQQPDLPEEVRAAIRAETPRCITRLDEYGGSPACPLFYYPLDDAAFQKAIQNIERRVQEDIQKFLEEYSDQRKKLLKDALQNARDENGNVDFFRKKLRTWCEIRGKAFVALTMGKIVKHYCMIDRALDFHDPKIFPLWNVKGLSVTYQMHEGLSMELSIDWTVSTPAPTK